MAKLSESAVLISASTQPVRMEYRADIDGLRAVAVLAVIVFHVNPPWLPGGFLGVDVFFVISGFVVSGSLLLGRPHGDLGSFILLFYARRLKRLVPALLLCVLGTAALLLCVLGRAYSEEALQNVWLSGQLALVGFANVFYAVQQEDYWYAAANLVRT